LELKRCFFFILAVKNEMTTERLFLFRLELNMGGWLENRASAHKNDTALQAVKVPFFPNRSYGASISYH
jgi:hypothetical protein